MCRDNLVVGPSLEIWSLDTCKDILRDQMGPLLGQKFMRISLKLLILLYTPRDFKWCKNCLNHSSYMEVMNPTS